MATKAKSKKSTQPTNIWIRIGHLKYWQQAAVFALVVAFIGSSSIMVYRSFAASAWTLYKCKSSGIMLSTVTNTRHACVSTVQNALRYEAYDLPNMGKTCAATKSLAIDGVYGAKTKAAVVCFQKFMKLAQDGVVGPNTYTQLYARCWDVYLNYSGLSSNVRAVCGN